MWFVHPYFLAALAGIGLPVLIHLLTRDRVRRVAFSTLRFFAGASQRVFRRRKFQEAILLALRMLVCALVALAFARPFVGKKQALTTGLEQAGTARVILADVSASMARPGVAEGLKRELDAALAGLTDGADAAALVTFADTPTTDVRLTKSFAALKPRLAAVAIGQGGTDLVAALKAAEGVLRQVEARRKEILLISDFQKTGWRNFRGDWKLPPAVKLVCRPLEPSGASANVAIAQGASPATMVLDRTPRTLGARVANYGPTDLAAVDVRLTLAGKPVDSQKVNLRAGGTADVRFRRTFDTIGDHPGAITIGADDSDRGDNVFYFNARVTQQIKVVILSGRPDPNPLRDAAFFLKLALMPTPDSPFVARVTPAAVATPADLKDAMVVVLANVGAVTPDVRAALDAVLRRGGGLLFLPGDQVKADTFNQSLAELSPCRLRQVLTPTPAAGKAPEASLAKIDYNHPIFQDFARPHHGDLAMPRFSRYWEVSYLDLAEAGATRVPARFDDSDRPALLERRIGQGVAMLLASPVDLTWNNLPMRAVFLPYLHETVRYLAVRTQQPTALRIGDLLPVPPDRQVKGPRGDVLPAEDRVVREAGFYTLLGADGKAEFVFAANRETTEADPTPLAADKIVAAIASGSGGSADDTRAAGTFQGEGKDPDTARLWWYVLLATSGLLVAELVMGNKTLRH